MEFNELIKKVAYNKIYNPFHPEFSEEKFKTDLFELEGGENKELLSFLFEAYLKDQSFINNLKSITSDNFDFFYFYLFSFINHDSYLLINKAKGILNQLNQANSYVISNIEKINISVKDETYSCESMTDFLIDILDFGFSLFKILKEDISKSPKELDYNNNNDCNTVYTIYKDGQKLLLLKDLYERVCFEKGTIRKIDEHNYRFEYFNPNFLIYHRVGEFRIKNNFITALLLLHEKKFDKVFYKDFGKSYISNVTIDEETGIKIEYANNPTEDEINNILYFYNVVEVAFIHYHFHIKEEYKDYIRSIAKLYTALHYLLKKITDLNLITANNNCYNNFMYKIKGKDLFKYLEKITNEKDIAKIQEILNILTHGNRKSFWEAPILQINTYYYFSAYSLLYTSVLYLIDSWLELKFSNEIDKKGIWFENLIYDEIDNAYNRNQYFSNRVHQKTFTIESGEKEEVDLVWETKNNILLAEIKCIDFPFTHRKTSYAFGVLEKASKQIIRKEKFLLSNKSQLPLFPQGNKKTLKCIITNYPFYSGLKINGIAVIDIGMFLNYIKEGMAGIIKLENGKESELINPKKYYNNEDEFSNNLEQLLEDSIFLNEFKKHFSNTQHKVQFTDNISITYPDVISI